jgi:hypothetical protein
MVKSSFRISNFFIWISGGVLTLLNFHLLQTHPDWINYPLKTQNLVYLAIPFLLYLFVIGLSKLTHKSKRFFVFASYLCLSTFILVTGFNKFPVFLFFLLCFAFYAIGASGKFYLEVLGLKAATWIAGFCFGIIIIHHLLFFTASLGIFSPLLAAAILVLFLFPIFFRFPQFFSSLNQNFFKYFHSKRPVLDELFLFFLMLTSFFTAAAPQTAPDGLVYRLPYMKSLIQNGEIPHHYLNWNWLSGHPVTLLLTPFYSIATEVGAAWGIFLFSIIFIFSLEKLAAYFEVEKSLRVSVILIFMASAPIWMVSHSIYYDIPLMTFLIIGFLQLTQFKSHKTSVELVLAGLSFGFAIAIKLNALIFVTILVVFSARIILNSFKYALLFTTGILVGWGPWLYVSQRNTGNPFFPFISLLTNPEFKNASAFTGPKQYEFFGTFKEVISLPWRLTYQTSHFGEYVDGIWGTAFLQILVATFFILIAGFASKKKNYLPDNRGVRGLALGVLTVLATSFAIKMEIARYWIIGIVFILFSAFSFIAQKKLLTKKFCAFLATSNLLIFYLGGVRINYGLPNGIGDWFWFSKLTSKEFHQEYTNKVEDWINQNIPKNETVFVSYFKYVHLINNQTLWISSPYALGGNASTVDSIQSVSKKYRTSHWLVNHQIDLNLPTNVKSFFFTPDRLVYIDSSFAIYNLGISSNKFILKNSIDLSPANNLDSPPAVIDHQNPFLSDFNFRDSIAFAKLTTNLTSSIDNSAFTLKVEYLDSTKNTLKTEYISRKLTAGDNDLQIFLVPPKSSHALRMSIYPWRSVDGEYKINTLGLDLFAAL